MQFSERITKLGENIKRIGTQRTPEGYKYKYSDIVIAVFAAIILSALIAVLILAFKKGLLPFASDGDAFDTIYSLEQSETVEIIE